VKALNSALLLHHYKIEWDIPTGYLCPPIPGRADYVHYLADLLKESGVNVKNARVLDVGTGSNGIYPILGIQIYGWKFVASDIDEIALANVDKIAKLNASIAPNLELRRQTDSKKIFSGIIQPGEQFDITMCNPPFHCSLAEAEDGNKEKLRNLAKNRSYKGHASAVGKEDKPDLNFAGTKAELCYKGGERKFIFKMIRESKEHANQCLWFTTLVSKKENMKPFYDALKKAEATTVKTINMSHGNKICRILAWTFKA
jgi:23S rRNA (adenine1618-N6)-methyltransferase